MKNKQLVSIIIPVYNVEKYLERCIESVINQTYKNIEIILVNDGSTDNSLSICKKYKEKDKRIILIDQKNSGVSAARNAALKIAKGEYIQFTDSDDWLEKNMIEEMVYSSITNDSDIVICEYKNYYEKNNKFENTTFKDYTNITFKDLISDDTTNYGGFPWNKLIKRKFIKNLYSEDIHFYENLIFFLENSEDVKKYSVIHKPLYNYNINESSAIHSKKYNPKKISILNALIKIIEIVDKKYKTFYKYIYIIKYYEAKFNLKHYKINDVNIEEHYIKVKKYYDEIRKSKELTTKNKIKMIIVRKFNIFYYLIKSIQSK